MAPMGAAFVGGGAVAIGGVLASVGRLLFTSPASKALLRNLVRAARPLLTGPFSVVRQPACPTQSPNSSTVSISPSYELLEMPTFTLLPWMLLKIKSPADGIADVVVMTSLLCRSSWLWQSLAQQ